MPKIEVQKLLYHLTCIDNIPSIFKHGLLSRAALHNSDNSDHFVDVADDEILQAREALGLDNYVPFHFFSKNPFDYAAVLANKNKEFVLITIQRAHAQRNNWQIICRHPLAREGVELLDYDDGMAIMNWNLMNERDYDDEECKSVCMAECLSPACVAASNFFKIYVNSEENGTIVRTAAQKAKLNVNIDVNQNMFVKVNADA